MSAKASGADTQPNGSAKHRQHHDGSSSRPYTPDQKAAVLRIKRCQPTAFYEILGLEEVRTTCSDGEIKKAYRKLSLLTHPDKNGFEGADEAFKLVSRAFQILSDPDKKAKYDKFGGDPDNRFGGGSSASTSSPFGNFARASAAGGRPGPMFEEEISPEDMFRQFFGGGMGGGFGGPFGGGIFDTGPGFVFNVGGGPGIRIHQFGGGRPRRRPTTAQGNGQETPPSLSSTLSSLLPLLILFVIPLLTSLFGGSSQASGPSVSFQKVPPYTRVRTSHPLKIKYYVKPDDVNGWTDKNFVNLDSQAEHQYMYMLHTQCDSDKMKQARLFQEGHGWLFQDEAKLKQAREMKLPACDELSRLRGTS